MRRRFLTDDLRRELLDRLTSGGTHLDLLKFITKKQDFIGRRSRLLGLREFIHIRKTLIYSIDCRDCDFKGAELRPEGSMPTYVPDDSLYNVLARMEEWHPLEQDEGHQRETDSLF